MLIAFIAFVAMGAGAETLEHYSKHPGNARAAAACSELFFSAGDMQAATSFASLAADEDLSAPEQVLANARVQMKRGQTSYNDVERAMEGHPEKAHEAAEVLLRGAGQLLAANRPVTDVLVTLLTAMKLDPTVGPTASRWAMSVVRARLTPRNASDLVRLVIAPVTPAFSVDPKTRTVRHVSAPEVVAFDIEVARRALARGWPQIAAGFAVHGLNFESPYGQQLADILVECARALAKHEPALAQDALSIAMSRDQRLARDEEALWLLQRTAPCNRGVLLRKYLDAFPNGRHAAEAAREISQNPPRCNPVPGLGMYEPRPSPFWSGPFVSDEKFFPGASYGDPLPPPKVAPDFSRRAAACRAIAPPLFPEPFYTSFMGRQALERIYEPGELSEEPPYDPAFPCATGNFYIVVDSAGVVKDVQLLGVTLADGKKATPEVVKALERRWVPKLRGQRYRPGRINGVAVWSALRAGAMWNCSS